MSRRRLAVLGVALVAGGWLGYGSKVSMTGGGMSALGGIAAAFLAVVVLLVLVLIGIIIAKQPDGTGGPAGRVTRATAALFAAAFGGGWVGAMAFNPQPVQLQVWKRPASEGFGAVPEWGGPVEMVDGVPGDRRGCALFPSSNSAATGPEARQRACHSCCLGR